MNVVLIIRVFPAVFILERTRWARRDARSVLLYTRECSKSRERTVSRPLRGNRAGQSSSFIPFSLL